MPLAFATVGIVARGVRGWSNLKAGSSVFPEEHVWACDLHPDNAGGYTREMREKLRIPVETVNTPRALELGIGMGLSL